MRIIQGKNLLQRIFRHGFNHACAKISFFFDQ